MSDIKGLAAKAAVLFKEFGDCDAGAGLRAIKGQYALAAYQDVCNRAQEIADTDALLSAKRNLGVVNMKMALTRQGLAEILAPADLNLVVYNFSEALCCFTFCLGALTPALRDAAWAQSVESKLVDVVVQLTEFVRAQKDSWRDRASILEKIARSLAISPHAGPDWSCLPRALLQLVLADEMHKEVLRLDSEDEDEEGTSTTWRLQLSLLEDLGRPLTEASQQLQAYTRLGGIRTHLLDEMREIHDSARYYRARVESKRLRSQGAEMCKHLLFDLESLDQEMMWAAVDTLRAAVTALIDADASSDFANPVIWCHESLAQAYSSLGHVFEKVVRLEKVANTLYLQVVQHAQIVTDTSGATFFSRKWYKTAVDAIQERRRRNLAYESSEMGKVRAPILLQLKPQLDAIQACLAQFESKSYKSHALLIYLQEKHPPKSQKAPKDKLQFDRDDNKVVANHLKKAVVEYHPDKQHNKDAGAEWTVLCEEIVKELNGFYEYFKGL